MRDLDVRNSPLTPSVEKAYHKKCIQLKRRLREVEESNDLARQRLGRLNRAIMKMRINRAFLMDRLSKMQELKDYESDQSSTRPPTPDDLPPRTKRAYRRRSSRSPDRNNSIPTPPPGAPATFAQPPTHHYPPQHLIMQPSIPAAQHAPHLQPMHHPPQHMDHRSPGHPPPFAPAPEPLINSLPNGTSVMLVAPGVPKPSPWHISELDPRHHVIPDFEDRTLDEQEDSIFNKEYLPFDMHGNPVLVQYDPKVRQYVHIFPGSPKWRNPVVDSVRTDSKESRKRLPRPPPGPENSDTHMFDGQHADDERAGSAAPSGFTAVNR